MQEYELTLIFKPDLTQDQADAIIKTLKFNVIDKTVWGKRLLSYPIDGNKEGLYMLLIVSFSPDDIAEADRSIYLNENIIRHLLVKKEK